jgi:membrane protein
VSEPSHDAVEGATEPRADGEKSAGIRARFEAAIDRLEERAAEGGRRRERALWYAVRLSAQLFRQWARDRCPQQAASLAFQTILSVVPALAVMLAAMRATGNIDAESSFIQFLSELYIPVDEKVIASQLSKWSENVTFESLGLVGLFTVVILAFIMFNSLEKIMNHIWRVERRRSLPQKFTVFYASATIGPAIIGVGHYNAARLGLTSGLVGAVLSFAVSYTALFLANFFIPAIKVRIKPALLGALVTTILFEAAKAGFSYYVSGYGFERYAGIYGAVAMVPLFLIWIYWSWLILLLGCEIAHAAQNIHLLERVDRRGRRSFENEILSRVTGPVAARLLAAVCEAYLNGEKTLSRNVVATRLDLDDDVLIRLIDRLVSADLLLVVEGRHSGLIPARPPSEITLREVLAIFRSEDTTSTAVGRGNTYLDEILRQIEGETDRLAADLTMSDLAGR